MAFETFRANFLVEDAPYPDFELWPSWLQKKPMDINDVLADTDLRSALEGVESDLVAGGPPCQGFSVGGARNGADIRNLLVQRLLETVAIVRPRCVLIENVEGMARRFQSKPGQFSRSAAEDVLERLDQIGYSAVSTTVDASSIGVPQHRRRLVIIGVRGAVSDFRGAVSSAIDRARVRILDETALETPVTARDALEDLDGEHRVPCPDSPKYVSGTYRSEVSSTYAKLMARGIDRTQIPDSHRFSVHGPRIISWYTRAHATQPPGRLSKQFMQSLGTKKDKKVLIDPDSPVSTITTHPDEFIHFRHPRNITVREMARLQSFPDNFVFRGRYTINGPRRRLDVARCSQVGNAVPPLLGQCLAYAVEELLTGQAPVSQPIRLRSTQLGLPALA